MPVEHDDPFQRIAESPVSPLRVVAGPGTGKTFALMRKVEFLLQSGADARRIFACSFTRTAAGDLARELQSKGVAGADRVRASTIHSYCFSILARQHVLQLTGRVPRTLMQFEERFLLEDLAHLGGVRAGKQQLKAFNSAWARLQSEDPGWPGDAADKAFHQALTDWLIFHRAMLVGELVPQALRYLRNNPAAPERLAFDHVLVDEYQDLNRAEQVLLDLLSGAGTLTVIGDEDQSIYSFKHAHPDGIADFDAAHPGGQSESLTECWRCPSLVVELANELIAHNGNRAARRLVVHAGNGPGEVHVVQWDNMDAEAQGLARFIHARIVAGRVVAGQVLVLAPRRQFGYLIRDALSDLGLDAVSFFQEEELEGDPKELNVSQAQQQFTLLRLCADPDDMVALRCWCGFGSSSLNAAGWARIRDHCDATGTTPRRALDELDAGTIRIPYSSPVLMRYRQLTGALPMLRALSGQALVDALFPRGVAWAEPFRACAEELADPGFSARDLCEQLTSRITQPELPVNVDYVRIMSLHKSKGLTAQLVALAGCLEGIVPSARDEDATAVERLRTLEEQRRLFYVAVTRTRDELVLSSVARLPVPLGYRMRAKVGGVGPVLGIRTIASRFIDELGPRLPAAVDGPRFLRTAGGLP